MTTFGTSNKGRAWMSGLAVVGAGALLAFLGPDLRAQPPRDRELQTVQATVRSFTKAPMGEVDGAELSNGTVIHWPPHLEDRFTSIVSRGDRVRVTGRRETGPEGDTHLEVRTITNLRTGKTARNDDRPPRPAVGPAADRDARLRKLEERLDRLEDEVRRLRRER